MLSQFDLVCSDGWLVDMYQATLNVGFLVGSIAIGYLADRLVWFYRWHKIKLLELNQPLYSFAELTKLFLFFKGLAGR